MFAPKVAKPQTKTVASLTTKLAPQRATLVPRPLGGGVVDHLHIPQRGIGKQASRLNFPRMRLYRKRRRDGMQYVRIPLHVTDIDGLIRMRLLKEERRLRNPSAPRLCLRTGRAAHRRGLPGALGVRPRLCAPPRLSRRPGVAYVASSHAR